MGCHFTCDDDGALHTQYNTYDQRSAHNTRFSIVITNIALIEKKKRCRGAEAYLEVAEFVCKILRRMAFDLKKYR